jgi:hypothetical protein
LLGIEPDTLRHRSIPSPELIVSVGTAGSLAPIYKGVGIALLKREGAEMQQRRPVMLVVLDGWGWQEDPADNAVRQGVHAELRPIVGDLSACAAERVRRRRWLAAGPDGQFRGWSSQHRGAGRKVLKEVPPSALANLRTSSAKRLPATVMASNVALGERRCDVDGAVGTGRRVACRKATEEGSTRPRRRTLRQIKW